MFEIICISDIYLHRENGITKAKGSIIMVEREHRSAAKTVLVVMLIVELVIVLLIFVTTILFSDSESAPSFLGHSFYISDMEKMDDAVKYDSMVIAENGRPDGSVVGGVILCKDIPGFDTGIFRVVSVEATTDTFIYNVCMDGDPESIFAIDAKNVIGECKYAVHSLGRMVLFIKSKIGVLVCVIIPVLVLAFIELILGFVKEMKRRDLQKRREHVRQEQAKNYSTKRHRDREFSVDDFKNEEIELRRKHLKSNNELVRPDRKAVRSLRPSRDERTKLMEIPAVKNIDDAPEDSVFEAPATSSVGIKTGFEDREYKEIKVARNSALEVPEDNYNTYEEKPQQPENIEIPQSEETAEPVEDVADVTEAAEVIEEAAEEPERKPLKPSMSLEEMMALMNDRKEKLKNDIRKNSN